mgnify:FL=1
MRGVRLALGVMGIDRAAPPALSCVDPDESARGCSDTVSDVAEVSASAAGVFGPGAWAWGIADKAKGPPIERAQRTPPLCASAVRPRGLSAEKCALGHRRGSFLHDA